MASTDPQKNRMQVFKNKGKDQDVSGYLYTDFYKLISYKLLNDIYIAF